MSIRLVAMVVLFFACSVANAQCYVALGVGESTINMLSAQEIEEDIFETEYSSGKSREDRSSMIGAFGLGCHITERLKLEVGAFDGFKHTVETEVSVEYLGHSADFPIDRTLRARGYMLSAIYEYEVIDRMFLFGRLGVGYAYVSGDLRAFEFPYSIHAHERYIVPVAGIGGRYAVTGQWSATIEYGAIGHYDVRRVMIGLQYAF